MGNSNSTKTDDNTKNINEVDNKDSKKAEFLKLACKNFDPYTNYGYHDRERPYLNCYHNDFKSPSQILNRSDELKITCDLESIRFPIESIQVNLHNRFTDCLISDLEKFPETNKEIFSWFFSSDNITSFVALLNTYQFRKDFYIQLLLIKLYSLQLFLKEIKFNKSANEKCKLYLTKIRELMLKQKEEIFDDIDDKISKYLEMLENKEENCEFNDMIHNLDHRSYFTVMDSQNIELKKLIIQKYCSIKI